MRFVAFRLDVLRLVVLRLDALRLDALRLDVLRLTAVLRAAPVVDLVVVTGMWGKVWAIDGAAGDQRFEP